jgi:hypothetical protein
LWLVQATAKSEWKLSRAELMGLAWLLLELARAGVLSIINHNKLTDSKQLKSALVCTYYSTTNTIDSK